MPSGPGIASDLARQGGLAGAGHAGDLCSLHRLVRRDVVGQSNEDLGAPVDEVSVKIELAAGGVKGGQQFIEAGRRGVDVLVAPRRPRTAGDHADPADENLVAARA